MSKRLDALLSSAGYARSEAQRLIKMKRTAINGVTVNDVSYKVELSDSVTVDGSPVDTSEFVYLVLYKPAGYVSTTEDTPDSVMKLVPQQLLRRGSAPAGRLDKDSEGLLIITNDGAFAHKLISPKKETDKLYYIETEKPVSQKAIDAIGGGITLSDGERCLPAALVPCSPGFGGQGLYAAEITLKEGKYHQVKRMLAACDNRVTRLLRLRVGPYTLDGMREGEIRRLTSDEIALI